MEISEYLDDECDAKVTFEERCELGCSLLIFSLERVETKIRIYPEGIKRLQSFLQFILKNELIHE
jgi:hypothetical protein